MRKSIILLIVWIVFLLPITILANWPRDGGSLKPYLVSAGFPFTFADWESGQLVRFSYTAFWLDMTICGIFVLSLSILCMLARVWCQKHDPKL